ncbi:hypothetical protein BS78_09G047800 [Paspalum vaginatum]|nr:hypothetical protein BS78_09G047800 [Paspalum vaginatum]
MLRVGSWDCGSGLFFEVGGMTKLQELRLMFHRDKTRCLTHGEFDFGIQHLPCLDIVGCYITYSEEARSVEDYEPKDPARGPPKQRALAGFSPSERRCPPMAPRGSRLTRIHPPLATHAARLDPAALALGLPPISPCPRDEAGSGCPCSSPAICPHRLPGTPSCRTRPSAGNRDPGSTQKKKKIKMEGLLVSAATGALKAVTVKLATLLGDEFKHMKDVRKEIEPLSKELDCMHDFLQKMSLDKNPDDQDKRWMTDVREMSYDIEDNLDDKSTKPKGLIKKCKKLLTKMKAHQRISKAIQDFKTQIKEVGDRNQRYRTGLMISTCRDANMMIDSRAPVIFKDASELVGIDESKNELISLLTENGSFS